MTDIRDRILARRQALRMSQKLLAGAAQVSRSTVQRAERGLPISDENMRSLCAVLDITLGLECVQTAPSPPSEQAEPPTVVASVPQPLAECPATAPSTNSSPSDVDALPLPDHDEPLARWDDPGASPDDDGVRARIPPPAFSSLRKWIPLSAPFVVGIAIFGFAWSIRTGVIGEAPSHWQRQMDRIERLADIPEFPVTSMDALRTCGMAHSVKDCFATEEASLVEGPTLWRSAPHVVRRDCLKSTQGHMQPITNITACLARERT
jgi:transcriptional regulator with XRE-family HTH domain